MDEKELHERGLKLRIDMFGREAVEKRMNAFGEFGKPLQHIINAYAYGDVWSRSALPPATKSLAMVAMMAAAGHPNELRVHLKGAVKNGCSAEQIQEILLLLAMYCGIPASNEAHRIAAEVLRETFRASDVVARLGADDFAVLVLDAAEETEDVIGPRLKAHMKRHREQHPESRVPLSLSLGIARYDSATPPIAADLLARAASLRAPA